jgi:hypothetical protein
VATWPHGHHEPGHHEHGRHRRLHQHRATQLVLLVVVLIGIAVFAVTVLDSDGRGVRGGGGSGGTGATGTSDGPPTNQPPTLTAQDTSVTPMAGVRLTGRLPGAPSGAKLQVEALGPAGRWVEFPLAPATDESGRFWTYVQLGTQGVHKVRVVDPSSGAVSDPVVVTVR